MIFHLQTKSKKATEVELGRRGSLIDHVQPSYIHTHTHTHEVGVLFLD